MSMDLRKSSVLLFTVLCLQLGGVAALLAQEEPPKLEPPHGELKDSLWERHPLRVSAAAFVLLVVTFSGWQILRRPLPGPIESPSGVAIQNLEALRNRTEDADLAGRISQVLRQYLVTAFHFSSNALTTSELAEAMKLRRQIHPETAEVLVCFLKKCDQWKFAVHPDLSMSGLVGCAVELVNEMESNSRAKSDTSFLSSAKAAKTRIAA